LETSEINCHQSALANSEKNKNEPFFYMMKCVNKFINVALN